MKKRWLLTGLFALALCACATTAQAAVTSGGVEYVWYTDMGRGESNENNELVSYEGQQLYLSADQGGSYAELPGLRETQRSTGLCYVLTVRPNAANDGGLSVKGRDVWSTEYTWFRDYSAQEVATALEKATKVTPVRVYATNGAVTVGSRYVMDYGDDDPTQPGTAGTNLLTGAYAGNRIVYSTDGVTWLPAEGECALNWLGSIWWDGSAFRGSDGHLSEDGIHWTWTETEREPDSPKLRYSCQLGPYHFEVVNAQDWQNGNDVYLMRGDDAESGVLLPHLGQGIRALGVGVGDIQAWYTPNDTVTVAVYDYNQGAELMYSMTYPISSLDWCLDNLSQPFREMEGVVTSGGVSVAITGKVNDNYFREQGQVVVNTGNGWRRVRNAPWGRDVKLLLGTGKAVFVQDTLHHRLYATEDGATWSEVTALRPADIGGDAYDQVDVSIAWTGERYIACRTGEVRRHGMMSHAGGKWYEGNTKVYFLGSGFDLLDTYDFGRKVAAVGFYDGNMYAQVANSDGVNNYGFHYLQGQDELGREIYTTDEGGYNASLGATVYRSADGKTWEPLGKEYMDYQDILTSMSFTTGSQHFPTGDPDKPLRSVAQAGRWRFALDGRYGTGYPEFVVKGSWKQARIFPLQEAIERSWITPGTMTAQELDNGDVLLRVTDLYTPSMTVEYVVPLSWLEEKQNEPDDEYVVGVSWDSPWELLGNGVDLGLMPRAGGERELVYRSDATAGQWMYLNWVPWSNSVSLPAATGKDLVVLDQADGRLYLSTDGFNWAAAQGDWAAEGIGKPALQVTLLWTGDRYFAARAWEGGAEGIAILDRDLNRVSSHDFGAAVKQIGYRNGVYYALADALYRSTDGVNWEQTDILQVRTALGTVGDLWR